MIYFGVSPIINMHAAFLFPHNLSAQYPSIYLGIFAFFFAHSNLFFDSVYVHVCLNATDAL